MMNLRTITLVAIAATIIVVSLSLGHWSENVNPQGIQTRLPATGTATEPLSNEDLLPPEDTPHTRDAFLFGVSFGLLACAFVVGIVGFILLIRARAKNQAIDYFIVGVLMISAVSLLLSYLVDDYFL